MEDDFFFSSPSWVLKISIKKDEIELRYFNIPDKKKILQRIFIKKSKGK